MNDYMTQEAISLLRQQPDGMVPVEHLYETMVERTNAHPGCPLRLRERLQRRPDIFLLLESPPAHWSRSWPEDQRREYLDAIRQAGLETGTHVALLTGTPKEYRDDDDQEGESRENRLLTSMERTLVFLGATWAQEPEMQADVTAALAHVSQLRLVLEQAGGGN